MTEELNLNNYLYHITNFNALEGILTQDTLKAGKTHHWKDLQSTGQFRNAVSLTRDLTFSSRYMPSSASVILVLDKDKLISKYKITPVADTANELNPQTGRRVGQSKAEECVYSDITNLHNYLVKILIKNSAQMPESTSDVLKKYNSKYNVPFTLTECLTEADHTQRAIDTFGTTYYRTRAGFMLKDGRLLDLTYGGGPREDHRNIQDAFDDMDLDSESDYLIEFMNEGNIRLIPEIPGIDIVVEPTDKQYAALKGYIDFFIGRKKYFGVQFSNKNGDQVGWKEYSGFTSPAEIILDIKEYFDGTSLNESYDYTVSDIIGTDTLYHATYKPYWEEIKRSGALRPKAHSNWDISGDFIYLSRDPDNAFSYAETSELVPEGYLDQIVVLEINANKLNLDLLDCDHNQAYGAEGYDVDYEDPQTWEEMQYAGNIPLNAIRELSGESLAESTNSTDIWSNIKKNLLYETIEAVENPEEKSFQTQIDEMGGDLKVTLYDAKNGHNYGAEYLEDLYRQNPSLCGKMLASIQILKILKNATPTKYSKYLKHGIYELRASVATNEARELYFFSLGNEIFITNGFTKKSQKTPEQEIKKAERLMDEYNSFRRS